MCPFEIVVITGKPHLYWVLGCCEFGYGKIKSYVVEARDWTRDLWANMYELYSSL